MWKKMKQLVRLNLDDLALCGGVIGGVFLLTHIITALAVKFSGEGSSLMLSGIILPIAAGFLLLLLAAGHVLLTFVQAVRFGQTRRRALALTMGQIGFEGVFSLAVAGLLIAAERSFAPGLWLKLSGRESIRWGVDGRMIPEGMAEEHALRWKDVLFIEDFALDSWWWIPVIVFSFAAIGFIGGALIQRFGKKGGWFLYALWMGFVLVFPRLPWRTHEVTNWMIPLLVAAAAAGFVWSVWTLLRVSIK